MIETINKLMNLINIVFNYFNFDGCKHIIISAILVSILKLFIPIVIATIIVLIIGIIKGLIWDKYLEKGTCELKDLYANIIGIIIGIL